MRFVLRILFWFLLLSLVGGAALVYFGVEESPLVTQTVQLTPDQTKRAKLLFSEHDPRELRDGEVKQLTVRESELALVSNYVISQIGASGSDVKIDHGRLDLSATLKLPPTPLGQYINLQLGLREEQGQPVLDRLQLGQVSLPSWALAPMLPALLRLTHEGEAGSGLLREVIFEPSQLQVTYQWDAGLVDRVRSAVVSPEEAARLVEFQTRLALTTHAIDATGQIVPLGLLVQDLFGFAASRAPESDPIADNQAAILVLSAYLLGRDVSKVIPDAKPWPRTQPLRVSLRGRGDFAKHFVVSAALASLGNNPIANLIGLAKEVDDSRGGSGFSFQDLAADRAGTRFGQLATGNPNSALVVQQRANGGLEDSDLMPMVEGLEEGLTELAFNQRFGGVDGPGYQRTVAEIDQRIDALSLYR